MKNDNFKNDANNVLPDGFSQVNVNAKWECCKCGWIGTAKVVITPVVNDAWLLVAWLLVCPNCGNKKDFYVAGNISIQDKSSAVNFM